jgi:hypothetical protein
VRLVLLDTKLCLLGDDFSTKKSCLDDPLEWVPPVQ